MAGGGTPAQVARLGEFGQCLGVLTQIADFRVTRDDVYLNVPALCWAAGFHDFTLETLWVGGTVVLSASRGFDGESFCRLVAEHGDLLRPHLSAGIVNPRADKFAALHAAAWSGGTLLYVPRGVVIEPPAFGLARGVPAVEDAIARLAPLLADDLIMITVEMSAGELPIIVSLQAEQVLRLGSRAEAMGAAAISLSPPRGSLWQRDHMVSGRLFGPALFPASLEILRAGCKLGLHMIASGGVTSRAQVEAMLAAGAFAIEVDTELWTPGSNEKGPVS